MLGVVSILGATSIALTRSTPASASTAAVSIGSASVVEGQMNRRYVKVPIALSRTLPSAVTISYATSDISASAGPDYAARSGTVTISAGLSAKYFAVTVWPDRDIEGDETFAVSITSVSGAALGAASGIATIIDDDPNAGPKAAIGDAIAPEVCEGININAVVVVTLSAAQTSPVVVQVVTMPGTASSGTDFVAVNRQITLSASQSIKEVKIPIRPDTAVEGSETFTVELTMISGPIGASRTTGTVNILDCVD